MRVLARIVLSLAAVAALSLPAPAAPPGTARLYLTAKDSGDRLADKGTVSFQALPQPPESQAVVFVDPGRVFQVVEGKFQLVYPKTVATAAPILPLPASSPFASR